MHLVPAISDVRKMLFGIRDRDILQLQGYLISAEDDEGWRWRSSLSRTDQGAGACELVWVERVSIE